MNKENEKNLVIIGIAVVSTASFAALTAQGVIDEIYLEKKLESIQQEIRQEVSPIYDRFQYQDAKIIIENFKNSPVYGVVPPPPNVAEASETILNMQEANSIYERNEHDYKIQARVKSQAGAMGAVISGFVLLLFNDLKRGPKRVSSAYRENQDRV